MIMIDEISFKEFESDIYSKYIKLFPGDEHRELRKIKRTCDNRIERIYKIIKNYTDVGFIMLEKVDDYPYYLDCFAIYQEYQNKGYGTEAMQKLLNEVVKEDVLVGEIEKIVDDNPITKKRFKFYERLGFKLVDSEYLVYNVLYNPILYFKNGTYDKVKVDNTIFDYYRNNMGERALKRNCRIIR